MKISSSLLFITLTCITLPASAVVVDNFKCSMEYVDNQGETLVSSSARLSGIRQATERLQIPGRDIKYTRAETKMGFEFEEAGELYSAQLTLNYIHATEFDAQRQAIRAAQHQCHIRSILLPDFGISDPCVGVWFEDPFASKYWKPVELTDAGVAKFDASTLPTGIERLGIQCELVNTVSH